MAHVAILVHKNDPFERAGYILHEIAAIWGESGVRVSVLKGPGPRIDADLAILHVDLTVVPRDYLTCVRQYALAINAGVTDTSKRLISSNLVRRGDGYEGPVIVKTNGNFGGTTEARLAKSGPLPLRYAHSVRHRLPWSCRSLLSESDYPVFDSVKQVPRLVWHNTDLVVERFLPERHGSYYCLRTWTFLGDRETNTLRYSTHPVVKSRNIIRREPVPDVPDNLRRLRRDLGFDFGKFDYSIVDGKAVLYDANRTPSLGSLPREQFLSRARSLAEGIRAFLGERDARAR